MPDVSDHDDAPTRTATEGPAAVEIGAASTLGRFAVLGVIGSGGMGQVFAAYDPQLDRKVALKLLHGTGDEVERQRLIREAQALARLAHPNVVVVHEVGTHEDRLFVAMEFVEGATLRDWMAANPPGTTERFVRALELLVESGRGIQAAHAAGLVHRDVKPRNILVGSDGRVRVVDFGLARTRSDGEDMLATAPGTADAPPPMTASASAPLLGTALTQTGNVVGTPAYMAPEQFRGGAIDHAADQFAFCVTAWEVLFGARPFGGTAAAMLLAIHDGAIERPVGIDVPALLEAALRRGLAHKAARRHRDMATLLEAFEDTLAQAKGSARPRGGGRRGWWVAGGVAVVASGAVLWLGTHDAARCEGAEARFAGIWDGARKTEIERAMLGTSATFAPGAWTRLESNVDAWRSEWIAAHRDACEATRVRGEQSERLLDLRMSCLDSRRQRMGAYLDLLANATPEVIANADDGFAEMPAIDRCSDVEYVEHRGQRSEDPVIAATEDEVLAEVARATTLQAAGDYEGALAIADAAVERAEGVGSDLALAHALLAQGSIVVRDRPKVGLAPLKEAYNLARAADIAEVAAPAAERLASTLGLAMLSTTEARVWLQLAHAEAARVGSPSTLARAHILEAKLMNVLGERRNAIDAIERAFGVLDATGDEATMEYAVALQARSALHDPRSDVTDATRALHIAIELLGADHPSAATFERSLAHALSGRGAYDDAITHVQRALEITERAFGSDSVRLVEALTLLATIEDARENLDTALRHARRAIALRQAAEIEDPELARIHYIAGTLLLEKHDLDGALAAFEASHRIYGDCLGDRDPITAGVLIAIGTVERRHGDDEGGMEHMRVGLALAEERLGTSHPRVAASYDFFAAEALRDGRFEDAYEWQLRARDVMVAVYGEGAVSTLIPEVNLCEAAGALNRAEQAIEHCERALTIAGSSALASGTRVAAIENNLGAALVMVERNDDALLHFERAASLWGESLGEDSIEVAIAIANVAEVRLLRGEVDDALAIYRRSLALRTARFGERHVSNVPALLGISAAALRRGDVTDAVRNAEIAVALTSESAGVDARTYARAREALGRALATSPSNAKQRAKATSMMREALAQFEALGIPAAPDVDRVRAWLSER